ncbi:MAG: class I SAM-dependent methyltransferase [Micropruina sp.]|nr:MAG: class I SAM-dependent methyltransferase [Micropruina sp.]
MPHYEPDWDARYAEADRVWSGRPNHALVREVAGLPAGRVLDVGCGEGADAVWLAQQGWDVTAIDVSVVALERARYAAADAGVEADWVHGRLEDAGLTGFDLVSACYPALVKSPHGEAERALLAAVAPGGLLLVVHHADFGEHPDPEHQPRFDHRQFLSVDEIAVALGDDWTIEVHERRPREISGGEGAHHRDDIVLRARRG